MRRTALLGSIFGLFVAAWVAAAPPPKVTSGTVVDEAGNVLFGTGLPGRVQITNLPPGLAHLALGPANPSDIVTVSSFYGNVCPGSPSPVQARLFNRLEGSDGSAHSFAIPTGKVLVVTSADLEVIAGTANHFVQVWLTKNTVNDANIAIASLITDNTGSARLHYDNPTGTVVKSGVNVCVSARDITAGAPAFAVNGILSGYLADDM